MPFWVYSGRCPGTRVRTRLLGEVLGYKRNAPSIKSYKTYSCSDAHLQPRKLGVANAKTSPTFGMPCARCKLIQFHCPGSDELFRSAARGEKSVHSENGANVAETRENVISSTCLVLYTRLYVREPYEPATGFAHTRYVVTNPITITALMYTNP